MTSGRGLTVLCLLVSNPVVTYITRLPGSDWLLTRNVEFKRGSRVTNNMRVICSTLH